MYISLSLYIYIYQSVPTGFPSRTGVRVVKRVGRILLTEMLLPRSARQGTVSLISIRGQAREALMEKFELDEGFQLYHPPFRHMLGQLADQTGVGGRLSRTSSAGN